MLRFIGFLTVLYLGIRFVVVPWLSDTPLPRAIGHSHAAKVLKSEFLSRAD